MEVTAACARLTGARTSPDTLFERGDALLQSGHQRLSRVFRHELSAVDRLVKMKVDAAWPTLLAQEKIACEVVVRRLLREGLMRLDQSPSDAFFILTAASATATALRTSDPLLIASLHGYAIKGRANALRHLGRFGEALADLRDAGRDFRDAKYCASDAGQVEYTKGTVLFKLERWQEALLAANRARALFIRADDVRRTAHASLLEAAVLFEQGDTAAGRSIWLRLIDILRDLRDHESLARVWQNLGACETRLRHRDDARRWLLKAAASFRLLGNQTELARTRWNIASYVATFRDVRTGVRMLRSAQHSFTKLGLLADAACVGLEAIELMIASHMTRSALSWYAQEVAILLGRLGLEKSHAAALDQLRRIAIQRNRESVLRDLRQGLRELENPCVPRPEAPPAS